VSTATVTIKKNSTITNRQSDPVDSPDSGTSGGRYCPSRSTEEYGIEKSELDQMWSYVARRPTRWYACDWPQYRAGTGVCFGQRKDEVFLQLKFARTVWDEEILSWWMGSLPTAFVSRELRVGKRKTRRLAEASEAENNNQASPQDHFFSKSELMHDLVIGLFIYHYNLGYNLSLNHKSKTHYPSPKGRVGVVTPPVWATRSRGYTSTHPPAQVNKTKWRFAQTLI